MSIVYNLYVSKLIILLSFEEISPLYLADYRSLSRCTASMIATTATIFYHCHLSPPLLPLSIPAVAAYSLNKKVTGKCIAAPLAYRYRYHILRRPLPF